MKTGPQLFGDNCAACHGRDGRGGDNYPDLTDHDWIWGGGPERIAETLRVGVNTPHAESRASQMPSFGRDKMLDPTPGEERGDLCAFAQQSLGLHAPEIARIEAGRQVFLTNCAACHGEDAKGNQDLGAPNLSDQFWIYGGDIEKIVTSYPRRTPRAHANMGRAADPCGNQDPCALCLFLGRRESMMP